MFRAGMASVGRMLPNRPGRIAAGAALAALMVGIVGNAMFFQKGHHPAPLFGGAAHLPDAEGETSSVPLPPPVPKTLASAPAAPMPDTDDPPAQAPDPAPTTARKPAVSKPAVSKPAASTTKPATSSQPRAAHKEDGISRLLAGTPNDAEPKSANASVLTAQKALRKLGYSVATDGRLGTSTRQAIGKFAQQHAVKTGEAVSPALLHELAVASGSPPG